MRREVHADHEVERWLNFVCPRGDSWIVKGERWQRASTGWVRYEERTDERESRTPAMEIDADAYGQAIRHRPTQADVDHAFRGLKPTVVLDPLTGAERRDYEVPLKNSDGTLNRYGKAAVEMTEGPAKKEREFWDAHAAQNNTELVETPRGDELRVLPSVAEEMARKGKVRHKPRSRRKGRR